MVNCNCHIRVTETTIKKLRTTVKSQITARNPQLESLNLPDHFIVEWLIESYLEK